MGGHGHHQEEAGLALPDSAWGVGSPGLSVQRSRPIEPAVLGQTRSVKPMGGGGLARDETHSLSQGHSA